MKPRKIIIIYVLIIALLLFVGATYYYRVQNGNGDGILDDAELECARVEGNWREFGNGCVDSCDLARNPETILCIQALTYGCDCGPGRCWNGESCEEN